MESASLVDLPEDPDRAGGGARTVGRWMAVRAVVAGRLHRMLAPWFLAVPRGDRRELDRAISRTNLFRLRILAWVLLLTMPILFELDRRKVESTGTPFVWDAWPWLVALRLTWIGSALLFLMVTRRASDASGSGERDSFWETSILPFWMVVSVFQFAAGPWVKTGIGPYLVAIFTAAAFLQLSGWRSLVAYVPGWLVLMVVLHHLGSQGVVVGPDMANGTMMTILAMVVSRVIYATRVQDFLSQRVVERQRVQLEEANLALAESVGMLRKLSFLDPLTEVPNRRYLEEQLGREWRRAARDGAPMAAIMIDIDHFKSYNDHYGHQAGDQCLIQVAAAVSGALDRPADMVARYGGDEFVVVLPGTDQEGAEHIAERIRRVVSDLGIEHSGSPEGHVTISLGLAVTKPSPGERHAKLVDSADQALYRAKGSGRNRCICA